MFNIKLSSENAIFPKKTAYSYVLYASKTTVIAPNSIATIPTDIYISFPTNYFIHISTVSKYFYNCGNVIDSDYRGEISYMAKNLYPENVVVTKGEPIAQLVFYKIVLPELEVTLS